MNADQLLSICRWSSFNLFVRSHHSYYLGGSCSNDLNQCVYLWFVMFWRHIFSYLLLLDYLPTFNQFSTWHVSWNVCSFTSYVMFPSHSNQFWLCFAYPATFPLDLVRRRKQLEGAGGRACVYNSGLLGTFQHIFRTEGFRGLYRGILPEYYKVVPSVGIVFMTYETLKAYLSGPGANDQC